MQLSKVISSIDTHTYTHIFFTTCILHACICKPDVLEFSGLMETPFLVIEIKCLSKPHLKYCGGLPVLGLIPLRIPEAGNISPKSSPV